MLIQCKLMYFIKLVDVVLPPNFERGVSLCIDGAATKPVKFGALGRTVLKGGYNI